ncbi:hypothetical protein D3C84_1008860 [compost metagenome]
MVKVWASSLALAEPDAPPSNTLLVTFEDVASSLTTTTYLPLEAPSPRVTLTFFSSDEVAARPLNAATLFNLAIAVR